MLRSLLLASAAAALAVPAVAGASSVTSTPTGPGGRYVETFTGGAGVNQVTFEGRGLFSHSWTDAAQPLTALEGCSDGAPVACIGGDAVANLGGGDDTFNNPFGNLSVTVNGGAGADTISANGNITTVHGDGGGDTIDVNANGSPYATGEGGDDHLRGGRGPNVFSVNLSGDADNDLVVGWSYGNDKLFGGTGNDQLFSTYGRGTLDGGAGNDVIVDLGVKPGGFTALGGSGADTIVGTPDGTDVVDAGAGNDIIDVTGVSDPEFPVSDTVACGDGKDTVYADADDEVAADCEKVKHVPASWLPGVDQAVEHLKDTYPDNPTGTY
jgi:Ca2+-binding RTX toxin-like protein